MATTKPPHVSDVEIGALDQAEIGEAAGVLTRALHDSPVFVAVIGGDAAYRHEVLARIFGDAATKLDWARQSMVARFADGSIVGLCRVVTPGERVSNPLELARPLPGVLHLVPRSAIRMLRWRRSWLRREPAEPHWHVGPLAIDPHVQCQGIGVRLMHVVCARLDAAGDNAYLETDRLTDVAFYERFGFAVIGQDEVFGVPCWSMLRPPAR